MPQFIERPVVVEAAGNKPKQLQEFEGRVNTGDDAITIARLVPPGGWLDPAQTPVFRYTTWVLKGYPPEAARDGTFDVQAGRGIIMEPGQWVRYRTHCPSAT